MRKVLQHFVVLLSLAAVFFSSCNMGGEKVIPRAKLSRIYAEMLMTDQWIQATPGVRLIADTSLVYAPILESYGYTTEDYMRSVDVYMDDPERFSRILRQTSGILDKRMKELRKLQGEMEEARLAAIIKTDFRAEDLFPYLGTEPYVHYYDSIAFVPDSVTLMYMLVPIERADTIYDQLRMIIRTDTLAVDSLNTVAIREEFKEEVKAEEIRSEKEVEKKTLERERRSKREDIIPERRREEPSSEKDAPLKPGPRGELPKNEALQAITKLETDEH